MLIFSTLILVFQLVSAYASPGCLATNECMEYEGRIIDLRSSAEKLSRGLSLSRSEEVPEITPKEFSTLVGTKGPEYFIPIDVNSSDLMILAGALSLGTVVFANDRELMDFVQDHKTETTAQIATVGNFLGREGQIPLAAGAYFVGAVMKNGKLKKIGLLAVASGLATQIVTEVFKNNFGRTRPNASDSPYDFFTGNKSFFSGHSSAAFSMATVIAEVYKDKPLVPYLAYGAAAVTAYARMHDNRHWASDVLAGAIAGHLITKILIRTLESSGKLNRSGIIIVPTYDEQSAGARVIWTGERKSELDCKKSGFKGNDLIRLCIEEAFTLSE
jgi:membrane-associated phospholipid phosphatase